MAGLVVVVTGDASSDGCAALASVYGICDRCLQGKSIGIGLGCGVIVVAEVTGVSCNSTVQGVDICLGGQCAIAGLS